MKTMQQIVTEDRRLVILRALAEAPAYSANDSILHRAMTSFGLIGSRSQVTTDLAWLAAQGLVELEELGKATVTVARLTQTGQDVAAGTMTVPGVTRPGALP